MRVDPLWIDYNGHLNMAYYNVLFDRMVDVAFDGMDIGAAYVAREKCSFFTVEVHVCYLGEVTAADRLDLTLQILGADGKRLNVFEEMRRARDGVLAATSEGISIHVDLATRRARPWPDAVAARIAPWRDAHLCLPRPERAGRSIGLRDRAPF
jgi:acyl-CoA thioester hydrolase